MMVSCQVNDSEQQETIKANAVEKEEEVPILKTESAIFIKDSNDYSARFLAEIAKSEQSAISLIDSLLIIEEKDTITFPQVPKIGKSTVLTARKDDIAIGLTIERINQTTIDYRIEMVEYGMASYKFTGRADLSAKFYLGSEMDESSFSGNAYFSAEFCDDRDTCYTCIRLGTEEGSGQYLLGKLIKNCNEQKRDIELDNFPTLIEK